MSADTQHRTVGPVTTGAATGTGVAGASAILLVWLLSLAGLDVPEPVVGAITLLLGAVGTLVGGFLVRPRDTPTVSEPDAGDA